MLDYTPDVNLRDCLPHGPLHELNHSADKGPGPRRLGLLSKKLSVVLSWQATRIPATIPLARSVRPSSHNSPYIRYVAFCAIYVTIGKQGKYI